MHKNITILVVEDDNDAYQAVIDAVKTSNLDEEDKEEGIIITPFRAKTFAEAQKALAEPSRSFEAAIIDLKLADDKEPSDDEDGEKLGGRQVVDLIFSSFQLPMFVYTGTPSHIEALRNRESTFFKIHKRDDVLVADILTAILKINQGGLLSLLGDDGIVQTFGRHFHNIFWKHLAPDGEYWLLPDNRDALTRYAAQHMTEYLERSSDPAHAGFMPMQPAEMYIAPAIKDRIYTGDILRRVATGELWIVLTPACDIVFQKLDKSVSPPRYLRKADFIALAGLTQWHRMHGMPAGGGTPSGGQLEALKKYAQLQRYYFLPKHKVLEASFVDFQRLTSIPEQEIDTDAYERLASVSGPFIKDIVAQFSYYYSRQGAPSIQGGMADWL